MGQGPKRPAAIAALSACLVLAQGMGLQACDDHDHGDDGHSHGGSGHSHGGSGHSHGGTGSHEDPLGPASGAVCPDDSTLTYENFGKTFMENYCTRCHSSTLEGDDRMEAPEGHDFDTLEGIRAVQEHVDQMAAAGPTQVNVGMPLGNPKPTREEREKLGEWLACDAPE